MTRKSFFNLLTIFIFSIFLMGGCATVRTGKTSVAGTWKYELKDLPSGQNSGMMIISKNGKELECHVKTDEGYELDFESFVVKKGQLTGHYTQEGGRVDVTGTFSGDDFTGKAEASGMTIMVSAKRVK